MKKMYLGLVGLGCGALLLTGCGGSAHTLKCTQNSDGSEMTITIYYNSDETKAENVKLEGVYDASGVSEADLKEGKKQLEKQCDNSNYKKCKVTTSGKKLVMTMEVSPDYLGYDGQSLKETKEKAISTGYDCE